MNCKISCFRKALFIFCALLPIKANAWEIGGTYLNREGSTSLDPALRRAFGVSIATSTAHGEIEFQMLQSQMTWDRGQYFVKDKNVIFIWWAWLFMDDLYVDIEKKEMYRIWEPSFRYWHKVYGDKAGHSVEIGSGLVLDVIEKHSETKVSYLPYQGYAFDGENVILMTPHYQNASSNEIYFYTGVPIGVRFKIPFYAKKKLFGYGVVDAEYMYGANPNKLHNPTIQDKPMGSLGGLRISYKLNLKF